MPEIDIAAEQAEYLEELRAALAEEHLGAYGTMRTRDALQYLIDQHEARDGELVEADASTDESDERDGDAPGLSVGDLPEETPAVEAEATVETDAADGEESGNGDEGGDGDATASDGGGGGGPSPLAQTMQLLEDNDDVWEEVESSDGKYAVTLPDGTTKHARTKDDVRALLFKHYR